MLQQNNFQTMSQAKDSEINMLRTKLSRWVDKEFGTLHPPEDKAVIYEDLEWTKQKDWIQTITIEIKKSEGISKDWLEDETRDRWKGEIRKIIGLHLKLLINSSMGRENSYISGVLPSEKGKDELVEESGKSFNYQFKIELKKLIKKRHKNETSRARRKDK